MEQLAGRVKARRAARLLKDIFEVVPLDARIIQQAMDSVWIRVHRGGTPPGVIEAYSSGGEF